MTAALITREIGPNRLAQPLRPSAGQNYGTVQPRFPALRAQWQDRSPVGFLSRLIAEHHQHAITARDFAKAMATRAELLRVAEGRDWSQRRLAKETGLSWGTWRRFPAQVGNLAEFLPKLDSALQRLKAS